MRSFRSLVATASVTLLPTAALAHGGHAENFAAAVVHHAGSADLLAALLFIALLVATQLPHAARSLMQRRTR